MCLLKARAKPRLPRKPPQGQNRLESVSAETWNPQKIITTGQPIYPEAAGAAGIQGSVVLHAIVSKNGRRLQLQVLNSQIDPDLARAAVEAVNQWRYQPTLPNGEPVEVDTSVTVNFKLLP